MNGSKTPLHGVHSMANRAEQHTLEHRGSHYIDIHEVPPVPQEQIRQLTAKNDPETLFHQQSVGTIAQILARNLGLDNMYRIHAKQTGDEHDCGKSDPRILPYLRADDDNSPIHISSAEARLRIKPHARYGARMAYEMGFPILHVVAIRTHHNPRVGYEGFHGLTLIDLSNIYGPDYLKIVEVLQIADTVQSALAPHHNKPPKPPLELRKEIIEMMKSGRYNPKMEKAFKDMFEEVIEERQELIAMAA